eukprot:8745624-Prorocentrum_lima.AAC.1
MSGLTGKQWQWRNQVQFELTVAVFKKHVDQHTWKQAALQPHEDGLQEGVIPWSVWQHVTHLRQKEERGMD